MANALEGTAAPKPTLREEANAPRIGRARFIGHTVGLVIIVALISLGLAAIGLRESYEFGAPPHAFTLPVLNRWAALVLSLLLCCGVADLMIRRRHDRNRSGIDCIIALALLEIGYVAFILHLTPVQPVAVPLGAVGVLLLYLLVMLAILPGSKAANRYGPPPRGD
jgi:uncharacterized membrane protein YhaH (DUF805 family)